MALLSLWRGRRARRPEMTEVLPGSVLKVTFRRGESGFIIAECPQLPGCMSQGKTLREAHQNIIDAIQSVLAVRMMGMLTASAAAGCSDVPVVSEESFRVKGPELIPV